MDTAYAIRRKVIVEGKSIRSVARAMSVSRNTAARYLGLSELDLKESVSRPRPVMEKEQHVRPRLTGSLPAPHQLMQKNTTPAYSFPAPLPRRASNTCPYKALFFQIKPPAATRPAASQPSYRPISTIKPWPSPSVRPSRPPRLVSQNKKTTAQHHIRLSNLAAEDHYASEKLVKLLNEECLLWIKGQER